MYLKQVQIKNICSIEALDLSFNEQLAGWHVLIGDNGSGKSTILKAIAATLIGPNQVSALNIIWKDWLKRGTNAGSISLQLAADWEYDRIGRGKTPKTALIKNEYHLKKGRGKFNFSTNMHQKSLPPSNYNWGDQEGWFSAAYGPFRRFSGGDERRNKVFYSSPKAGAHLSLFGEDIALTEALEWLSDLDNKRLRKRKRYLDDPKVEAEINEQTQQKLIELTKAVQADPDLPNLDKAIELFGASYKSSISEGVLGNLGIDLKFREGRILHYIKEFINQTALLPNKTTFTGFDLDGNAEFEDSYGNRVNVYQMSDGYRSILSLTFELIRQLLWVYEDDLVFQNIAAGQEPIIALPGVVLIDEIDAHLHPTWQIKIGYWFTKYFPKIQFLVSTHSPLVCRACENGSVWRLGAGDHLGSLTEIKGIEKDRLVYGNILDAYGTELFGRSPVRSKASKEKLRRLGELNMQFALGQIEEAEQKERKELLKILSTDDPTGFQDTL